MTYSAKDDRWPASSVKDCIGCPSIDQSRHDLDCVGCCWISVDLPDFVDGIFGGFEVSNAVSLVSIHKVKGSSLLKNRLTTRSSIIECTIYVSWSYRISTSRIKLTYTKSSEAKYAKMSKSSSTSTWYTALEAFVPLTPSVFAREPLLSRSDTRDLKYPEHQEARRSRLTLQEAK